MDVYPLFQYYRSMSSRFVGFLILMFIVGCSDPTVSRFVFSNLPTLKINNLADINADKKSELIFWNTSSMSKSDKFLELCFFETINLAKNNYSKFNFGEVADIPFIGYFNEDSIIDYGSYRSYPQEASSWFIKSGTNDNRFDVRLGRAGDFPVPSDYDGDERYDIVVYHPSDSSFEGVFSGSRLPFHIQLGINGDIPVPKDYDGDGRADFVTYRQKNGVWTIKLSRNNSVNEVTLGGPSFLPIPSDYDGDGKADLCVWNSLTNSIKAILSTHRKPISEDVVEKIRKKIQNKDFFPVPSDYDGDGSSELAFWSSSLNILISFNIRDGLKQKTYHFPKVTNSIPVNNFLLRRILSKQTPLLLFKNGEIVAKTQSFSTLFKWDKKENVIPFVSDFDGDYVPDSCLWSQDSGTFLCTSSRVGWKFALPLGQNTDIPIIGDFNSDNITDIGVYRPSLHRFYYRFLGKSVPYDIQVFEISSDAGTSGIPQIADYDGDKKDDFAIYNPKKNIFIINQSSNQEIRINPCKNIECATSTLVPIVGDFDGDSKSDPGVIELKSGKFNYYSSLYNTSVDYLIKEVLSKLYTSADLDGDLKSDLIFLDTEKNVLGIAGSVNDFKYKEVKLKNDDLKNAQLVNCLGCAKVY